MILIQTVPYRYRHLPIGGGGYVTGFHFHPSDARVLYCRTDIGGVYRFDGDAQRWVSLIDHVTPLDLSESYPISVALDPARPSRLYIASGTRAPGGGRLSISNDGGATFRMHAMPCTIHGNFHGRGAGERLLLAADGTLWYASQLEGLFVSRDEGVNWQQVECFPETACTFIAQQGNVLLVGTEGLKQRREAQRGHSLYASFDGGATFVPVSQPAYVPVEGSRLQGLVAQRCAFDDDYAYVSYSANGRRSQVVEHGYTCDCGDCSGGCMARYRLMEGGLGPAEDITPVRGDWGYCAVDSRHGLLITASICKNPDDSIWLSRDQGESWTEILCGMGVGQMDFRLPYMRPRCNGGGNLVHWMTDVKLDPHQKGTAWFNTGTGVFRTQDVTAEVVTFTDWCDGMEETVHLGVYAPPSGDVQVLDMIGDLGGFAFRDIDRHCDNSFADGEGNRYITCINADWPDADPAHLVVTARGNWKGKTKGGLIVSYDGARSWTRLDMPMGLDPELDALLTRISGININAGWVALSADGTSIVWAVADRFQLHARYVIVSHDGGRSFVRSSVLDLEGNAAPGLMKPLADRCDPRIFYGFGEAGQLYVSRDGGLTFQQKNAPESFPKAQFGLIDGIDKTEIRVAGGEAGVIYLSAMEHGAWKLVYDRTCDAFHARRMTDEGDTVYALGLGLGREGGDYLTEPKMLYMAAVIRGEYGFYCTPDEGASFVRINNAHQMYGDPWSIDGDCRVFGRFYIATGSSGLLYGDINKEE